MKKALLVGINYIGQQYALKGCVNDTINMKEFIKSRGQFPEENITLLNDVDSNRPQPTKNNILQHIDNLVSNIQKGDTLLFHFSGHGTQVFDRSSDESDRRDEVICPVDYAQNGFITDDDIYMRLVSKIPEGAKLIIFMDCCHSGSGADLKYNFNYIGKQGNPFDFNTWGDEFKMSVERKPEVLGNVIMFSGCIDSDTSADAYVNNVMQGAFTFALLQILQNEYGKTSNRVLQKHVNCVLAVNKFTQTTQFSCNKLADFDQLFAL
jgi:metacaspase-1